MNYIQNYRISSNSVYAPKFGASNPVTEKESQPQSKEQEIKSLSNVTPDYGVKAPMSYTKTGELKISDDLTAQCYKLANGQKVVIVPKDGTTVVKTYVNSTIGTFTKRDAMENCPSLGSSSVESALKKLVEDGTIIRKGQGRASHYIRKDAIE